MSNTHITTSNLSQILAEYVQAQPVETPHSESTSKTQEVTTPYMRSLQAFEEELLQRYNSAAVHALIDRVKKLDKTSLTDEDKVRLDIFCHYFDIECKYKESIHKENSPKARLINHYLKYAQKEIQYRLKPAYSGNSLGHREMHQCEKNIETFLSYISYLLENFDEITAHKALTKIRVLPSEILTGEEPFFNFEVFKENILTQFGPELSIRERLESLTVEELKDQAQELKEEILQLKNYIISEELIHKLALKIGKTEWLTPLVSSVAIENQAALFEACRLGEEWAESQEEIFPIPGSGGEKDEDGHVNLNYVYFLKDPRVQESAPNIAVFKDAVESSSLESLVYDAALIFGLESAFVPTKLKTIKDKVGSVQIFQDALSWKDYCKLKPYASYVSPTKKDIESLGSPTETSLQAIETENVLTQEDVMYNVGMIDFLKAGIGAVLIGNRDLHTGNFFFKPKGNGEYSIIMFDNEMSFFHSNYLLIDKHDHFHLPHRNALLTFPHADTPIKGSLKDNVKRFVNGMDHRYDEFLNYLSSSGGKHTMKNLRHGELSYYAIKALRKRIDKLKEIVNQEGDFTYRDMVYACFPLYPTFLKLTKQLYSNHPEMVVGYHPIQELCDQLIERGKMTEKDKEALIEELKVYQYR